MKINILICTISILLVAVLNSFSQNTYIPDDNFEKALIELGYDSWPLNDSVPTANISTLKKLSIPSRYIENLTGIEDFMQLEILDCSSNYLQTINISSNVALKELSCENTWISALDIKSNPKLISLNCNSNRLTELDVRSNHFLTKLNCVMNLLTSLDLSHCKELDSLDCSSNSLTSLDIQQNTQLTNLNCQQNQISSLNTSLNPKIETLNCQFNQLKNLDVTNNIMLNNLNCSYNRLNSLNISQNTFLKVLNCYYNSLTELDISNNHEINTLYCSSNKITTLNLSLNPKLNRFNCANNQLIKLDLRNGNNEKMGEEFSGNMNATGNLKLFSIEVDNIYAAAAYSSWSKDFWAKYSSPGVEYSNQKTYIPDDNFEQALIDLGFDSGELNDSVLTEAIKYIKTLNIGYKYIADLTGIKDFVLLERLYCISNQLSALDLSSNKKLKFLYCEFNELVDLDFSSNTELMELSCAVNKLTGLNLQNGNNSNLNLNARENPDLLCIQVDDEDASYKYENWYKDIFTAYATDCSGYKIKMTYVPDDNFEQALIDLGLDSETTLNDSVPTVAIKNLKSLDIRYKNINDLTGIKDFSSLEILTCNGNQLITVNFSANSDLQEINCSDNQLTEIIFGNNLYLTQVKCNDNQLSYLDLSKIKHLMNLFCNNNNLINLDITENKILRYLNASNNKLTGINLRNGNNSSLTNLDLTSNENLFCIQVDDPLAANEYDYWLKSGYATYSVDCSNYVLEMTYVPDDNFEQDLINQNFDFGALNDSVPSAAIGALKYLNIQAREIHDLTGIEDFKSLETLICSNNFLTTFDLSSNINLKNLQCANYLMEHLDIKNNTKLETLNCAGSSLTTVDLSSNPVLHTLNCGSNKLQNLDLSANPLLKNLNCGNNYLQDLDLTSNKLIESLSCSGNLLSNINIQNGNNQNIINFISYGNQPACILVDNIDSAFAYPNWQKDSYSEYSFDCSNYKIQMTYMPDDKFEQYFIDGKYDVILNDSVPTEIIRKFESLGLSYRDISDLTGIQDFASLTIFNCDNTKITSLDVSNNTKLESLICVNNQLTSLKLGQNNQLSSLNCSNNNLTNIDLHKCNNLKWFTCENNKLTSLDLSNNKELLELWAQGNALKSLNVKNGNNLKLRIDARNNPNLTCIQVDDDNNAPNYFFWYKDKGASYSENCALQGMSYIPDDNFEQGLIDLKYDEGTLDNYIISSQIAGITSLNLSGKNIQDMKGLEDFFTLKTLDLSNNNLSFLELERIQGLGNFRNFSSDFIYWPQANFGENIDTIVNIDESITLDFPEYTPATKDFFRWKKNGTFLEKPDQQQLIIEQATLADNGSYMLTVRNTFFPKLTLESKIINLKVLKPLKTNDISLSNIIIYPNPTSDKIFIDLQNQTADLKIFNIAGITVFEEKDFATSWLDLTDYLPGIYVFRFEIANSGVINRKVIVE